MVSSRAFAIVAYCIFYLSTIEAYRVYDVNNENKHGLHVSNLDHQVYESMDDVYDNYDIDDDLDKKTEAKLTKEEIEANREEKELEQLKNELKEEKQKVKDEDRGKDEAAESVDTKLSDRQQQTALLLTVFLGALGVGRFYLGLYPTALCKFVLFLWVFWCPIFTIYRIGKDPQYRDIGTKAYFFMAWAILLIVLIAWIIIDIVLFALNEIHDEDGLMLDPM